ncbi:SusC/RagA family TonB-linked outer membrane protein [Pseudochryseolinea flava]|uniref:SusC/RagA family TonB-linked outer membrane protein n=1 Tax=Pseudochryseolinea flava TaxID=2059302 RepID=A0A364Y8A2_9BACT|nr:TonB-dependent receptor [Pseudochryseolinea flava]RAW02579.1 SusC/RagA family TonB-linked outer membrane protein [Pseudochryseolinea flava]
MKKNLPETLPFIVQCLAIGFCFLCFFSTDGYALSKHSAIEVVNNDSFVAGALLQSRVVTGTVLDNETNEGIPGVSVVIKGTNTGAITDVAGAFSLEVPSNDAILLFSAIGYASQEVPVAQLSVFNIRLITDISTLNEIVVVGYGEQKKESIVGAITQTSGTVLQRTGGVSNVGAALTGNLPGVVTMSSSGMPGEEDPMILIRAASSWNNRQPLILVDGVERPMQGIDINAVESISVLKDASATAVFGVKGANGVILITTKRGKEGAAKIEITGSTTLKVPSKLPNKLDSYDALMARNIAIEHELGVSPSSWSYIRPQSFIDKYRNPASLEESERYPNIDWQEELFRDYAMAYNANLSVSGGTSFVKYFTSADFQHEGDLFRMWDNGRNYDAGYGYNRLNVRSNLDFQLTKTTVFKINLAGSNGVRKSPWNQSNSSDWAVAQQWAGAYNIAPDVFMPKYSDGSWGFYPDISNVSNSAANLALGGAMTTTNTRINTDFILQQDLNFVMKGLNFRGSISWDNAFIEWNRGVNDLFNNAQQKWINPLTGSVTYKYDYDQNNHFDFMQGVLWSTSGGEVRNNDTQRNLNYQLQTNWARTFDKHNVAAMAMFMRQQRATGSEMPRYREDWVFRGTYDYNGKYFAEYNGAYNGSEQFSKDYRYAFFNSGAIGWMISEESFMKDLSFLDLLKVRSSFGAIGDDNIRDRWLYLTQWAYGGTTSLDVTQGTSPYPWYREAAIGNPDVRWETVKKFNIGIDYAFFDGLFSGSVDFFRDKRTDILVNGVDRAVPSYFGGTPPTANIGSVEAQGFEIVLNADKTLSNGIRLWASLNLTHAKNKILNRDDPALYPDYRKQAGFAINQHRSFIDAGYVNTYDEIYGSPQHNTNDIQKLPGNYYIIDFNGDGIVDDFDRVAYGYSDVPQNTYSATVGFDWKGFSVFAQFYGVNNVTREVPLTSFGSGLNTVYDMGTWWSRDLPNADVPVPRWMSTPSYYNGTQFLYDGSYVRLKNAEIAYTLSAKQLSKVGFTALRIFLNGNNLWVWSRMPDDRESNFAGAGSQGAYPTVKRYNLGLRLTL